MAQIMTDHGMGPKASEEKAAAQQAAQKPEKKGYVHNSNFIDMDDPHLNDPSTSPQSTTQQRNAERMASMGMKPAAKKRTRKESIDLSQSFSQIVEGRLAEDSRQETIARAQRELQRARAATPAAQFALPIGVALLKAA
jgi:pyruvate/2-oxoglutarate dehydrogenase complex dihydrolipoamide acyltransferase (E2) component